MCITHLTWCFQVHFHPLHFRLFTPDIQPLNAKIQVQNNTSVSKDVVAFLVHQQVWQAHINVDCPERWHQTDWVSAVGNRDECQRWNSSQDTKQDLRHNSAETGVWNGLWQTTGGPQIHMYNRYTGTTDTPGHPYRTVCQPYGTWKTRTWIFSS